MPSTELKNVLHLWKRISLSLTDNVVSPMTLTQLFLIRKFLVRVVARGVEEDELIQVINALDSLIHHHQAA
jgi:hypothetical protein